jgi:hypothetical protein
LGKNIPVPCDFGRHSTLPDGPLAVVTKTLASPLLFDEDKVLAYANSDSESSVVFESPLGDNVNLDLVEKLEFLDFSRLNGIVIRKFVVPSTY